MGGDKDGLLLLGRCLSIDASSGVVEALRQELAAAGRDWRPFIKLANRHKITPALWSSLCRKECERVLPEDLQRYLAEISQRNARRNALLRQQASEAIVALNRDSIQPIILKGGLHLFGSGFDRAIRMMADLDFLIPRPRFDAAVDALRRIGYSVLDTTHDRPEYSLTLFRSGVLATIDLHRDLGPQRTLLPADVAISAAAPISIEGIDLLSLSSTHRILHSIVNTTVCDPHFHMATISLCRLYDLVLLSQERTAAVDWDVVCQEMANEGLEHAVVALLSLTRELFGMPIPPTIRRKMRARLYVTRYFLQARYGPLMSLGRLWGRLTHTFGRARIDYFYPCERSPLRLTASRLRHAAAVFSGRDVDVLETIANDLRAD